MKKLIAALAAASLSAGLFAIDFGASILNFSVLKDHAGDTSLKLDQTDTASAWISIPFDNNASTTFTANVKAEYENDFAYEETTFFFDIETLRFMHRGEKSLFTAGRYTVNDLTGLILSQSLDGLGCAYMSDSFTLSASAAYTGLLNSHFNSMLNEMPASYIEDNDKAYDLAQKFAIGIVSISFPYLFADQTLTLENVFSAHLQDETFTRNYTTLALNGGITSSLYYNLSSTLEFYKFDEFDMEMANLSKFSLSYYGQTKALCIELGGVYASGNQGPFKPFKGFTSLTAVNTNGPFQQYTELAKAGIAFSFKPVESMIFAANANSVFKAFDSIEYGGFEYSAALNWQILSDVFAGAKVSMYFDKDVSDSNKTEVSLTALITF